MRKRTSAGLVALFAGLLVSGCLPSYEAVLQTSDSSAVVPLLGFYEVVTDRGEFTGVDLSAGPDGYVVQVVENGKVGAVRPIEIEWISDQVALLQVRWSADLGNANSLYYYHYLRGSDSGFELISPGLDVLRKGFNRIMAEMDRSNLPAVDRGPSPLFSASEVHTYFALHDFSRPYVYARLLRQP